MWLLSVIVLIHKSLFALVMGLAALRSLEGMLKPFLVMLTFSVSSPLGIGIGAIVCRYSSESAEMDLTVAVLESISTGTFLFVVFVELLPNELQLRESNALTQLILVLVGFVAMAALQSMEALTDG